MTQLLCGHAAAKWFIQDFSLVTFGFLFSNIVFLLLGVFIDVLREHLIKKMQHNYGLLLIF